MSISNELFMSEEDYKLAEFSLTKLDLTKEKAFSNEFKLLP